MRALFTGHAPKRTKRSFTLLELVVAIVILAILSALAIPTFAQVITNSKTATTEASLNAVYTDARALCVNQPLSAMGGCLATAASETTAAAGLAPGQISATAAWTVAAQDAVVTTPGVIGWSISGANLGLAALTSDGTTAVYLDAPRSKTWSCPATTSDPAVAVAGIDSCSTGGGSSTTSTTTTAPGGPTIAAVLGVPGASPLGPLSSQNVPAATTTLNDPLAVAISPDNTTEYVSNGNDSVVYAVNISSSTETNIAGTGVDLAPGNVATVAGTGVAGGPVVAPVPGTEGQLNEPAGLAVSPDGSTLYITDSGNNQIDALDLTTGIISDAADQNIPVMVNHIGATVSGASIFLSVGTTDGLQVSPSGDLLYLANSADQDVLAINLTSSTITDAAGTGFNLPPAEAVDVAGPLPAGGTTSTPATSTALSSPTDVVLAGNLLYVADFAGAIYVENISSSPVTNAGGTTTTLAPGEMTTEANTTTPSPGVMNPTGITMVGSTLYIVDPSASVGWALDTTNDTMTQAFGQLNSYGYSGDGGPASSAVFSDIGAIGHSSTGLYVVDSGNNLIREITPVP